MQDWRKNVRSVTPYVPGEQPKSKDIIKLNTNENPYPPSPAVEKAMADMGNLRLYPDPAATELTEAIADYKGLAPENVFVGVGSDDVLAMAFLTFFNSEKPLLFPDITYSFYDVWAELFGIPFERVAVDESFRIRMEDYDRECGGIIFPNPNAPTGILMERDEVEAIVRDHRDAVVIVDEAYIDFGGRSAQDLIHTYDNLLVVQTFSKSRSLAGLRIGFAMGSPELIRALSDVKYSFNSYTMNLPSIRLGTAAVKDEAYFRETTGRIIRTRERFKKEMAGLGFTFPDSMANFVFVTHKDIPAEDIFQAARAEGIFVRYFKKPRISNYLRITIGTEEEMESLLDFLKKMVKK